MSTEATQGTGADVIDLENLFAAEETGDGNSDAEQRGQGVDTQGQNQNQDELELDDQGNPVTGNSNGDVEVDLELETDPNDPTLQQVEALVIPDDHKVTLTVDGKPVEKSYGELVANAQKYEGANQKFEEAAAIRKEYSEKVQGLGTRENQLAQVLNYYIQQSNDIMQAATPNWEKLLAEDPQGYLQARHGWELKQAQLAQARQVQANLQAQQQRDNEASLHQRALQAKDDLVKAIPEWTDPRQLAAGAQEIDHYLAQAGIPVEARSAIDSASVLLIARKAMLYDRAIAKQKQARMAGGAGGQAQPQQGQAQPQAQQRRPAGRVERPGAATPAQTAASRQNLSRANATKAFNANPSVDTLADFYL